MVGATEPVTFQLQCQLTVPSLDILAALFRWQHPSAARGSNVLAEAGGVGGARLLMLF